MWSARPRNRKKHTAALALLGRSGRSSSATTTAASRPLVGLLKRGFGRTTPRVALPAVRDVRAIATSDQIVCFVAASRESFNAVQLGAYLSASSYFSIAFLA